MKVELQALIESDLAELKRLRELSLVFGSADPSKEFVTGGPAVQCRFAAVVDRIIDLENKIIDEINDYIDQDIELRDQINAVDDPTYKLFLRYKYIEHLSMKDIAQKMGYTVRQVYNIQKVCTSLRFIS